MMKLFRMVARTSRIGIRLKYFALVSSLCWCFFDANIPALLAQGVVGGVSIDPQGMLHNNLSPSGREQLEQLRREAAALKPNRDVERQASLRKVSLRRLEHLVAEHHASHTPLPAEIQCLAGLHSVQYLFLYPESGDAVLAGPAEGWEPSSAGELLGRKSRRPVLRLDDLIVALRYVFGQNRGDAFLGCSIEPTPEGIVALNSYFQRLGKDWDDSRQNEVFSGMEQALGPQAIKLYGAPGQSRFALVMVAADYRLKRIAMGHDPSPVNQVASYLDLATQRGPGSSRSVPQHRWWFVGDFESITHTADKLAFHWNGAGLKVATAPSSVAEGKGNVKEPKPTRAATQFAETFTRHFTAMSEKLPVFAELQNLVGLSVAACLIQQQAAAGPVDENRQNGQLPANELTKDLLPWRPVHWLNAASCPIAEYPVPTQTPSLVNSRHKAGKGWMVSVSGGVEIDPTASTRQLKLEDSRRTPLNKVRRQVSLPADDSVWWWD